MKKKKSKKLSEIVMEELHDFIRPRKTQEEYTKEAKKDLIPYWKEKNKKKSSK